MNKWSETFILWSKQLLVRFSNSRNSRRRSLYSLCRFLINLGLKLVALSFIAFCYNFAYPRLEPGKEQFLQANMPRLVSQKVGTLLGGLGSNEKYLDKDSSTGTKTKQQPCSKECSVPAEPGLCTKDYRTSSSWLQRLHWCVSLDSSGLILDVCWKSGKSTQGKLVSDWNQPDGIRVWDKQERPTNLASSFTYPAAVIVKL